MSLNVHFLGELKMYESELHNETNTRLQCPECNQTFSTPRNRKRHMRSIHFGERYRCEKCDKIFHRKETLHAHSCKLKKLPVSKIKNSDIKAERYFSEGNSENDCKNNAVKKNMRFERKIKIENINLNIAEYTPRKLNINENGENMIEVLSCFDCGKSFSNKISLERHIKFAHSKEIFTNKNNSTRRTMSKLRNEIENRFCCELCGITFKSRRNKSRHIKSIHFGEKYTCERCERDFNREDTLKKHLCNAVRVGNSRILNEYKISNFAEENLTSVEEGRTIISENIEKIEPCDDQISVKIRKKVACWMCGKLYAKKDLNRHMKSFHLGERYACEICNAIYRHKDSLLRHLERVHVKTSLFSCKGCEKFFSTKENLTAHACKCRFDCAKCEKSFNRREGIKYHLKSEHANDFCENNASYIVINFENAKLYNCTECDATYTHHASMQRHINSVHLGVKFQCNICKKEFTQRNNLKKHICVINSAFEALTVHLNSYYKNYE